MEHVPSAQGGHPKISAEYYAHLQRLANQPVQAIVRVESDVAARAHALASRGFDVRRTLHLISALAVTAPAHMLIALADEPWVLSIEPDVPVRAYDT